MSRLLCFPCFQHELICSRLSMSGNWDRSLWQTVSSYRSCRQRNEQWNWTQGSISAQHAYGEAHWGIGLKRYRPIFISTCQACIAGKGTTAQKKTAHKSHTARRDTGYSWVVGSPRDKPSRRLGAANFKRFSAPSLYKRLPVSRE